MIVYAIEHSLVGVASSEYPDLEGDELISKSAMISRHCKRLILR